MFLFLVLALVLFVVFLTVIGRQSGSIQGGKSRKKEMWPDANSDLSLGLTDASSSLLGSVHEDIHQNAAVVNCATDSVVNIDLSTDFVDYSSNTYSGGELGTALADAIDGGGNSAGAFDSCSSDFGAGGTSN